MPEDLSIRDYSPSTVRACVHRVADFAEHFNKSPEKLDHEDVRSYQLFLLNQKRVKLSSYIQSICALRFLYNRLDELVERPVEIRFVSDDVSGRNRRHGCFWMQKTEAQESRFWDRVAGEPVTL